MESLALEEERTREEERLLVSMEEYYGNVDGCGVRSPSGGGLTESQLMVLRCYYNAINKWPRDKDLTQVSTATLLTIPTIQVSFILLWLGYRKGDPVELVTVSAYNVRKLG